MIHRNTAVIFQLLLIVLSLISLPSRAAEEEASNKTANTSEYLELKPAFITNFGGPGPIHFLKAEIALRVGKDPESSNIVQHHLPQVRHVLVMLLSKQTEDSLATMQGKEQIRQDALTAVRKIFQDEEGKPLVEDLLFNNFIVQR